MCGVQLKGPLDMYGSAKGPLDMYGSAKGPLDMYGSAGGPLGYVLFAPLTISDTLDHWRPSGHLLPARLPQLVQHLDWEECGPGSCHPIPGSSQPLLPSSGTWLRS